MVVASEVDEAEFVIVGVADGVVDGVVIDSVEIVVSIGGIRHSGPDHPLKHSQVHKSVRLPLIPQLTKQVEQLKPLQFPTQRHLEHSISGTPFTQESPQTEQSPGGPK